MMGKKKKPKHRARMTWRTRDLERDARTNEEHAKESGVPVPPGKGKHRRWTLQETLSSVWNGYKEAFTTVVGGAGDEVYRKR